MNYIDFNALRATEKYVRDMSMSYHVLPAMREQVDALNYLVKEYKESDPELASFAKALRRNIVDGYRIEYTRSSMWGNQKLWIRNSSVDVSKMAKGEDFVQRRMAGKPDWATSALFDIGQRVSGMYSNPIYNDITHVGSEAINTSEKFIKAQVTPIYSVFNKDRQNVFKRYVYDYGVNRKEMKPFDKVGILMAQVRVANLMKNYRGRVVS